ncbi:MAG: hypothetical protein NW220_20305 [Leptolyngbyaceae cyanobacterium bins.349]|nr:hypothetical protein [Leptolyngbyaceae cyanobacterium bins.349]
MLTVSERRLVQEVVFEGQLLAIIISADFKEPGIHFFTPDSLSQQVAYMSHPAGKHIQPHVHNPVPREVFYTQEVLLIKQGKLRVDFYTSEQEYLESYVLKAGDVILLVQGGHGFEVLEDLEMIEVKQGPYVGEHDKTRFSSCHQIPAKPLLDKDCDFGIERL